MLGTLLVSLLCSLSLTTAVVSILLDVVAVQSDGVYVCNTQAHRSADPAAPSVTLQLQWKSLSICLLYNPVFLLVNVRLVLVLRCLSALLHTQSSKQVSLSRLSVRLSARHASVSANS